MRIVRGATLNRGARRNRLGLMHSGLADSPDGFPYIMVHESCGNLIRTLPELPYSETDVEDVDTDSEDHAYDSSSIGIMTLQPKFGGGALVNMGGNFGGKPFGSGWQQNANGEVVPSDILQSLAQPTSNASGDGEY